MLQLLLRPLGRVPLSWVHALGALAGRMVFRLSPSFATRLTENLAQSGLARGHLQRVARAAAAEAGKAGLEAIAVWQSPLERIEAWTQADEHWAEVEQAYAQGKGLIVAVPHLGSWEIVGQYCGHRFPMTAMYRRPKLAWLDPLMRAGRERDGSKLVGADMRGVRALLRALKRGEAIGVLPDQAPGRGEGVWAEFFGRPAYTMTLAIKLSQATGAAIAMGYAERLPKGRGFVVRLRLLKAPLLGSLEAAARTMNAELEETIARQPEQYLWSYNRYKVPAGVTPPPAK